ncbi:MAG: PilZ domain-containing protein [Candidatus Omnitrophota bacterium]
MSWQGHEKRRFPRVSLPCTIIIKSSQKEFPSRTENISGGGIRIILEEPLEHATLVDIDLKLKEDVAVNCCGKIIWVVEKIHPDDKNARLYDVGIQFTKISDDDRKAITDFIYMEVSQEEAQD